MGMYHIYETMWKRWTWLFLFTVGLRLHFARKETPQGMTNVLCPTPVSRFHLVEEKLYNPLLGTFVSGPPVHGAETGEGQVCD